MPNRILTTDTYHDEIRGRLGVDSGTLSDTQIDAPSVLPIGEARVISRVPDYANLQGDDEAYVYAAAIAMVAAILAPTMGARIKASEGDSDYKYTNTAVNWNQRASDCEDEAYSMIDYISTQSVVELPQIGASGPTRAKAQCHNRPTIFDTNQYLYPNSISE